MSTAINLLVSTVLTLVVVMGVKAGKISWEAVIIALVLVFIYTKLSD